MMTGLGPIASLRMTSIKLDWVSLWIEGGILNLLLQQVINKLVDASVIG